MLRRPEVEAFADLLEETLRKHDDIKTNYMEDCCTSFYLFRRLIEEAGELGESVQREASIPTLTNTADVANFAMMIAVKFGGLMLRGRAPGGRDG